MASHVLAIFGMETARAPAGLEGPSVHHRPLSPAEKDAEQARCSAMLEQSLSRFKASNRRQTMPGKGVGFAYEHGPFCSYATRDGVHILFSGEVSQWPGIDSVKAAHDAFVRNSPPLEENDAHWLLDFYRTFVSGPEGGDDNDEILERALSCLAGVKGSFAFVIYDDRTHRVLAARDADGAQPMYWGATEAGQLLFGSNVDDLAECNPTATAFPPGTLFASTRHLVAFNPGPRGWVIEGDDCQGDLLSFMTHDPDHWRAVKAIPRITSKGVVCGSVYKVSSQADVAHPIIHG